jgi:hypothetical protein
MIFCCYWRKTTHKKNFTNLSSLEKCILFLCPLIYSLIEAETIQRKKKISSHIPFLNDSRKSVIISNKAISNEKLNCQKPSLAAWSLRHFNKHLRCRQLQREYSHIHQTNKNSSNRVFPTPTFRRQSKEPPILGMETMNALEIKEEPQPKSCLTPLNKKNPLRRF